nr:serine/arginine-rich splicing factor SR45-like [Peromyscus maniculatus bairdii]
MRGLPSKAGRRLCTSHRSPRLRMGATCACHRAPACSSGVERRRRGEPAGTAGGAAHARRGARSARPCRERILRPPRTGAEHLTDSEAGPGGAPLTKRTGASRSWRPAAGWVSPRCARAASCPGYARPGGDGGGGGVRGSGRRSRVRMLELGPARRSARREPRRQQLPGTERRPALTPPPGDPRGARYASPPPPPPPGARELRVACERRGKAGRERRRVRAGDGRRPGEREEAARARDPQQTLPKF